MSNLLLNIPYIFLLFQDNVASSSGSSIKSFFIGMGFLPSLVDKVIEEKGRSCVNVNFVMFCLIWKWVGVGRAKNGNVIY